MATMLNVYDRVTRKKTAVLQNAYNIVETQEINQIYSLTFTLPAEDEKNKYCLPRHYIRYGETGELYRIKSPRVDENNTSTVTYECEHVITTLCDDILFGSFVYGGKDVYTTATINWLLNKQKTKNWKLGSCAFSHQYEYNWEQENILNALYSIPKEFASDYMWTFDTTNYPWTLNLTEIDKTATPEYYLRAKSNILSSGSSADYANICTRIYPLGYGEGVNQLTIKDATVTNVVKSGNVNVNGVPSETSTTKYNNTYIQSPQTYIDKYGIVEKVLVDRRFEQANTLFGYAKQMLEVYQEPTMSRSFDVTDLYPITNKPLDDAQVGKICKMTQDGTTAYITKTQRRLDIAGDLQIDLSTKASDIASNVADLADRIRIESVYSQGATQLYQHSKDANATTDKGMVMSLYFPSEMKQINKVLMRLKLGKFRSYSQATKSADVTVKSCENVTVTVNTNENALTTKMTSLDGGGTTSSSGGTSVTVGGGATVTGKDTGESGVSVSVSASGTVSAPMATKTSDPSTDTTSGTTWAGSKDYTSTEYTPNGAVNVQITTDGNLYGETYGASGYDSDGLHSHTQDDIDNETNSGSHSHKLNVNAPTTVTSAVKINSPAYIPGSDQTKHLHFINFNVFAHDHNINHYHTVSVSGSGSGGKHTHTFTLPNHTHTITAHRHNLPDLTHKHSITLKGHKHDITLNGHSHEITAGIFESGNPTKFDIYVKNEKRATVNAISYNGDITQWLLDTTTQTIPRNTWIDVEIRPDSLAYVQASVFVQGFVQSRGGGNY